MKFYLDSYELEEEFRKALKETLEWTYDDEFLETLLDGIVLTSDDNFEMLLVAKGVYYNIKTTADITKGLSNYFEIELRFEVYHNGKWVTKI